VVGHDDSVIGYMAIRGRPHVHSDSVEQAHSDVPRVYTNCLLELGINHEYNVRYSLLFA
jgi:hypothetical protein